MQTPSFHTRRTNELLPDFCTAPWVVRVLVLCEAVAIVLALAGTLDYAGLIERLLLLSVYLQWIGICSAAVLCLARRHAGPLGPAVLFTVAYIAVVLVTLAITEVTVLVGRFGGFAPLVAQTSDWQFVSRGVGISAVITALALRYFWLRAAWRARGRAEAGARLRALEAQLRPHFLFNTLNSIAALIAVDTHKAEDAVQDLASLLRIHLARDTHDSVSLADELALVEAYVRIEKLRLAERLTLDWRIAPAALEYKTPGFSLQPLVENAIGHGVAERAEGGTVTVGAEVVDGELCLWVINPLAARPRPGAGNRQALANIEQRLRLVYGDAARLITRADATQFRVDLVMPAEGQNPS